MDMDSEKTNNSIPAIIPVFAPQDVRGDPEKAAATTDAESSLPPTQTYPEGGTQAWLVVFASFCGMISIYGIINSAAIFQEYLITHQLKGHTPAQVGWIFSINLFIVFFLGIPAGPIFDAGGYGPRALVIGGTALMSLAFLLLGLCTQYWQFIVVYSCVGGIGGALLASPTVAAIGHYFFLKRGFAIGIAFTAGSIGGVVFPLLLQKLFPSIGFAWSTRVIGFILLALAIPINIWLPQTRFVSAGKLVDSIYPHWAAFKDPRFSLCTAGIFFMEWGLFIPITYISSYVTANGQSTSFSFTIVAILNAGSFFGRFLPGLVSDYAGRFNVIIVTISLCVITVLGIWLPSGSSQAAHIGFVVAFGFASGSNLSLIPVCIGQLCSTENFGRYLSTAFMLVAFGTLTGVPIAGQILVTAGDEYWGLIMFSGLSYFAALFCFVTARVLAVGWKPTAIF